MNVLQRWLCWLPRRVSRKYFASIAVCHMEQPDGSAPPTIRQLGVDRIVGRRIIGWSVRQGTYGTAGNGFFGLELDKSDSLPQEWLVLTIGLSGFWLLLDDVSVEGRYLEGTTPPLVYQKSNADPQQENLSGKVLGFVIEKAIIADNFTKIYLRRGQEFHLLEFPEDTMRLPLTGRTKKQCAWDPSKSQRDAWVISESGFLWTE